MRLRAHRHRASRMMDASYMYVCGGLVWQAHTLEAAGSSHENTRASILSVIDGDAGKMRCAQTCLGMGKHTGVWYSVRVDGLGRSAQPRCITSDRPSAPSLADREFGRREVSSEKTGMARDLSVESAHCLRGI